MKILKTNSVFDTNFLRFLEFLKTLKFCFQSDWGSFFAWIWSSCCVYLIINYVKCSLFGFLFVFNYCVATTEDVPMGKIVKFVSGSSSIANLGLFGKLKVQFKYWWIAATKSANASLQYQPVLFLTLLVYYSKKQAMKEALRDAAGMSRSKVW